MWVPGANFNFPKEGGGADVLKIAWRVTMFRGMEPGQRGCAMNAESESTESERARLLEQRDALRKRLEAIKRDYRRGLDADWEEQAQQLENAEVLDGIARAARAELDRIERRLAELS